MEDKKFTRSISIRSLGTSDIYKQLVGDIELLFEKAVEQKLVPRLMVVGPVFLEIASVQALIRELQIDDWDVQVNESLPILSELISNKILTVYKMCDEHHGKFGEDPKEKISIYFDPEEDYITLQCVNPKIKSKNPADIKTKDGYPYLCINLDLDEVLIDFKPDQRN